MAVSARRVEQAYGEADFKPIDVNITSLSDFAGALRRELTDNLEPALKRIGPPLLDSQPRFGLDPELELEEPRLAYDACMRQAKLLLRNLVDGVRRLADAAEQIGARYAEADQFAMVRAGEVEAVLPSLPAVVAPEPDRLGHHTTPYAV